MLSQGCTLRGPRKPRRKAPLGYNLVIVQINLKGAPVRQRALLKFLASLPRAVDVVAIQDPPATIGTWSSPDYNVSFRPARNLVDAEDDNFDTGGDPIPVESVAFYVHKSIDPTDWECHWWLDDEDNQGYVATLRLNTVMGPIKIHNVYNRNRAVNFQTLLCPSILGPMSVLLGDVNECHRDWAGGNATSSGRNADVLANTTKAAGMVQKVPPNTATFHPSLKNRDKYSTIDITFVSQDLNTRTKRSEVLDVRGFESDHHPVKTTIRITPIRQSRPRMNWHQKSRKPYLDDLESRLKDINFPSLNSPADVEQYATALIQAISGATKKNIRKSKPHPVFRRRSDKASKEVRYAADAEARTLNRAVHSPPGASRDKHYDQFRIHKRLREKSEATYRFRDYARWVADMGASPAYSSHLLKKAGVWEMPRSAPLLLRLQKPDGSLSISDEQSLMTYAHHMCSDVGLENDCLETNLLPHLDPAREQHESPQAFSNFELWLAMSKLKMRKQPGPDEVYNEAIIWGKDSLRPYIRHLVQGSIDQRYHPECFRAGIVVVVPKQDRDDYTLCKNWRPITLLSSIGKIIERVVANKLTELAILHGFVQDTQFAFRKRSTTDALEYLFNSIWKGWCTDSKKRIFSTLVSLDIAAAYDNVNRADLLQTLIRLKVPDWMIEWIASFLSRRKAKFRTSGHLSENVWLNQGIPQGSPLSPILFILAAGKILDFTDPDDPLACVISFSFVDDTHILIQSSSYELNNRIAAKIHQQIVDWAGPRGFDFDPAKYAVMHFHLPGSPKRPERIDPPEIEGLTAECIKRQHRILGVIVDDSLTFKHHIMSVRGSFSHDIWQALLTDMLADHHKSHDEASH